MIVATILLALNAVACDINLVVNPDLPGDCVEVVWVPGIEGCVDQVRDMGTIPEGWLREAVWTVGPTGRYELIGYIWMTPDWVAVVHNR
jgi:hypothetical protein